MMICWNKPTLAPKEGGMGYHEYQKRQLKQLKKGYWEKIEEMHLRNPKIYADREWLYGIFQPEFDEKFAAAVELADEKGILAEGGITRLMVPVLPVWPYYCKPLEIQMRSTDPEFKNFLVRHRDPVVGMSFYPFPIPDRTLSQRREFYFAIGAHIEHDESFACPSGYGSTIEEVVAFLLFSDAIKQSLGENPKRINETSFWVGPPDQFPHNNMRWLLSWGAREQQRTGEWTLSRRQCVEDDILIEFGVIGTLRIDARS